VFHDPGVLLVLLPLAHIPATNPFSAPVRFSITGSTRDRLERFMADIQVRIIMNIPAVVISD
jgi:hypothetical protein